MIKGFDISHWNYDRLTADDLVERAVHGFVMMKATEGRPYVDPCLHIYASDWMHLDDHLLGNAVQQQVGFYHYCHPEWNEPDAEMDHFLFTVEKYLTGGAVLALDIEGNALRIGKDRLNAWTCEAVRNVIRRTGKPPIIYCGKSTLPYVEDAAALDAGLWLAKWSKASPTTGDIKPWPFWAMWQSGLQNGLDIDWFNGSREQFRAYAVDHVD